MRIEYTPEQEALRQELRTYFADLMTADVREQLGGPGEGGPVWRKVIHQLGEDGWLGIGWPKEYGGQGRPATDQFIFYDEAMRAHVPVPFVTLNTVGPTLIAEGSDEHKQRFLPGILSGDVIFAIGYTEPGSGTDLASLRTRAVRDGDEYVISGNKVFTSGADDADYVWLACRTDPDTNNHKGISIVIVPTSAEGFSWSPIVTVGGNRTTSTYYDDVRVPVANRVGDENAGWALITSQLNHERVGLAARGGEAHELFDETVRWAATTETSNGERVIDLPWVQRDLAEAHARVEAMKLLNWRLTAAVASGDLNAADASAAKVYGTEALITIYHLLMGVLGAAGALREGSPGSVMSGRIERAARSSQINTFGGGVNEIQREIVAWMGLGMARGKPALQVTAANDVDKAAFHAELKAFEGQQSGPPVLGDDPVNVPMIRHWVEANGDRNPVYLDEEAAAKSVHGGIVAPPVMLQAWCMRGLKQQGPRTGDDPQTRLMQLIDGAGFTSVVATNCEQEYMRYVRPGDHLTQTSTIESVSEEKTTALGVGHFVTNLHEYHDQHGELVGTMRFRILKFRPARKKEEAAPEADQPKRPRPAVTADSAFWFEGAKRHELLIQRCAQCGRLRHPPGPMCPECRSLEWDTVQASGRGTVYSYVVNHYPQIPAFEYPLPVALIELEEGTRLVSNVVGVEPDDIEIGMPVEVEFVDFDDELTLPQFRPVTS